MFLPDNNYASNSIMNGYDVCVLLFDCSAHIHRTDGGFDFSWANDNDQPCVLWKVSKMMTELKENES